MRAQPREFLDRQRVEFGAEQDRRSGLIAVEDGSDPVAAQPIEQMVGPGRFREKRDDAPGSLPLLSRNFRMPVQVVPEGDGFGDVEIGQLHGSVP